MSRKDDFERIFLGRDNEPITDDLIKEILLEPGNTLTEEDLRFYQREGYTYCRPRQSFIGCHSYGGFPKH